MSTNHLIVRRTLLERTLLVPHYHMTVKILLDLLEAHLELYPNGDHFKEKIHHP